MSKLSTVKNGESGAGAPSKAARLPKGIKPITSQLGYVTFSADAGRLDKKRRRLRFDPADWGGSQEKAIAAAKQWLEEEKKRMAVARASGWVIDPKLRPQVEAALALLENEDWTLVQAVRAGIEHLRDQRSIGTISLAKAIEIFLRKKAQENCDDQYQRMLKISLAAFATYFKAEELLSEINPKGIEAFLESREMGPVTWNNWRRNLSVFFSFALKQKWVKYNVAEEVTIKKLDLEPVKILRSAEVKRLLKTAATDQGGLEGTEYSLARQIPWLILGLFAGLRRDEADQAKWEHINWESGYLEVQSAKSRGARHRYVQMEPVLKAWLERYQPPLAQGPVGTGVFARRNDLKRLSEKTSLDCLENLYRHSFGSHHLWHGKNKHATMLLMGHTNVNTFDGYYNHPLPQAEADAYWTLTPEEVLK